MTATHIPSNSDLDDFQNQLFRQLVQVTLICNLLAIWMAINHRPFSILLIGLWSLLFLATYVLFRVADFYPFAMRCVFVIGSNAGLILAMLVWEADWLPAIGLLFAFISIILLPRLGIVGLIAVLLTAVWLVLTGQRAYPYELAVFFVVSIILAWLVVNTLYTALHWYRTMHLQADQLLQEAREQRFELKRTLKSLETAYEVQQRIHKDLIKARQHAEEARRMKERFAANISHELRTPLNIVLGFSEVMHLSPEVYGPNLQWPPTLIRDISQIYRSSSHLLEMIDDILDLSHVDLSQFAMELEPTPMTSFLLDTMKFVDDLFKNHPAELTCAIAENLPTLNIDRTRIRQVLLNLLNNAKRFTNQGWVRVEARQVDENVVISVTDTGPGIAEEDLPYLFDEFYQVDYSSSRKHGGAGLGLAVSKHFVQAHAGLIWVDSHPGEGACFTFTLPIPAQAPTRKRNPLRTSDPASMAGEEAPCVALLETDRRMVDTARRYLQGYEVIQVFSQEQLPTVFQQHHPQAVIYDQSAQIAFPEYPEALEVPWITCSLPGQVWGSAQSSIFSVLAKPVTSARLIQELARLPEARKVLVIDDDRGFVQLIERMVQASGLPVSVSRAYTGSDGLERIRNRRPDLVMLDLVLPDLDGLAILEAMQQDEALRHIPVILLTAASDQGSMANEHSREIRIQWPTALHTWQVLGFLQKLLPALAE